MDARSLSGVFTYTYPRTDADVRNRELWESSQPLQPILITTTLTLLGLLPVSPPRPPSYPAPHSRAPCIRTGRATLVTRTSIFLHGTLAKRSDPRHIPPCVFIRY